MRSLYALHAWRGHSGAVFSMSFVPINDDHAVQSVVFSVLCDRPLSQQTIAHVQINHSRWQPDLPAMQTPQMFGIEIGGGGAPRQVNGSGVEFSYLRPDGTPAWQLRFQGPIIEIECTRYTRWDRIWQQARRHLETALAVVVEGSIDADVKIFGATLQYVDRFSTADANYDLSSLFNQNEYMPSRIFEHRDVWHFHQGWFDYSNELGPVLNNLNLDARYEPPENKSQIFVNILHLQQLRYTEQLSIATFQTEMSKRLDAMMQSLHNKNKEVVGSLLDKNMGSKIGLSLPVESVD